MKMQKCVFLTCSILLALFSANAQEVRRYIQPEYKMRYRDTVGTFLQVQNYFDRTYYTKEIYFRIKEGDEYYGESLSPDTTNGLSKVVRTISKKADLRINKCFEIKDIIIQENKINRVEIREETGTLSLIMVDVERYDTANIPVVILTKEKEKKKKADTIALGTLPLTQSLPIGSYKVLIKTIPEYVFTFYSKPAIVKLKYIREPVFFDIKNEKELAEIRIEAYNYYKKKYYKCYNKVFDGSFDRIKILPKVLYKVQYRKIGKRKFKTDYFYAQPKTFQNRKIE